jgi:predicted metal-binding protein
MDDIKNLLKGETNCRFIEDLPVPNVTAEAMDECRSICKKNNCGAYGKSYVCPPLIGSENECIQTIASFEKASVLMKEYSIDADDKVMMDIATRTFQNLCRMVKAEYVNSGIDVLSLATGKCSHCENCNCLSNTPCGAPNYRLGSLNGYGIKIEDYLDYAGIRFNKSENKDKIVLYGLFLTKEAIKG